jgi:hypothetical protein
VLFRTSSRWSYLLYVVRGILGAEWTIPGIELGDASRIRLTPTGVDPVYLEADGEMLGQLPAEITLLPNALTLLAPRDFAARARAQAAARQAGSPVPPTPGGAGHEGAGHEGAGHEGASREGASREGHCS